LDGQSAAGAFGPTTAAPSSEFQVTSMHSAKGANSNTINPNAYAVCDGEILSLYVGDHNL